MSYRHLLLPLDGSLVAESALSTAVVLAEALRAKLTLLEVACAEPPSSTAAARDAAQIEDARAHALAYLEEVRHRVSGRGVEVHVAAEAGTPDEVISTYAREHGVDLIVMASHGRTGLRRWALGSVAERVLKATTLPVMLVRAGA